RQVAVNQPAGRLPHRPQLRADDGVGEVRFGAGFDSVPVPAPRGGTETESVRLGLAGLLPGLLVLPVQAEAAAILAVTLPVAGEELIRHDDTAFLRGRGLAAPAAPGFGYGVASPGGKRPARRARARRPAGRPASAGCTAKDGRACQNGRGCHDRCTFQSF